MTIVINWPKSDEEPGSTEYFEIDLNDMDQIKQLRETRISFRDSSEPVFWKVKCKLSDDRQQIIVKYNEDRQEDDKLKNLDDTYYGTLRIILEQNQERSGDQTGTTGCFRWEPKSEELFEGYWSILDDSRNRTPMEQWDRKSGFRKKVLKADDGKCVITSETLKKVLDAAHICGVAESDNDGTDNGITLRTDIHRLYDRGMFLIDPRSGKPAKLHKDLTEDYKALLEHADAQLPRESLRRVKRALQHKWEVFNPTQ